MSQIRIDYYGHSCFRVSYEGKSAVFDPYKVGSVPGIDLPEGIEADRVYCSHEHGDHNAKELIQETGNSDPFEVSFLTVPHDDAGGSLRGMNRITMIKAGQCTVCHMGDIGRMPTEDEYAALKQSDIVMIPVGGHYTIDAVQAKKIIDEIKPALTILMHFRKGKIGYDVIADLDTVLQSFKETEVLPQGSICFDEADIPHKVITLEPIQ